MRDICREDRTLEQMALAQAPQRKLLAVRKVRRGRGGVPPTVGNRATRQFCNQRGGLSGSWSVVGDVDLNPTRILGRDGRREPQTVRARRALDSDIRML